MKDLIDGEIPPEEIPVLFEKWATDYLPEIEIRKLWLAIDWLLSDESFTHSTWRHLRCAPNFRSWMRGMTYKEIGKLAIRGDRKEGPVNPERIRQRVLVVRRMLEHRKWKTVIRSLVEKT